MSPLSDSVFILPIAFKNDRSFNSAERFQERNVARYENRGREIRESIDHIQYVIDSLMKAKNYLPLIIEETIWENGDTIVNSKKIEAFIKKNSNQNRTIVEAEPLSKLVSWQISDKKKYLLIYNECKWSEGVLLEKMWVKYYSYALFFDGEKLIYYKSLKKRIQAMKVRRLEDKIYTKLLEDIPNYP